MDDTINGIYAASINPNSDGEIFNIGANNEITIIELANILLGMANGNTGSEIEFIPYDQISKGRKYQDVMRRVPDTAKAQRILGVQAQTSLEEGLRRTFEWQKSIRMKEF